MFYAAVLLNGLHAVGLGYRDPVRHSTDNAGSVRQHQHQSLITVSPRWPVLLQQTLAYNT